MTQYYVQPGYWADGYAIDKVDGSPPAAISSIQSVIPSYAYQQYNDDSDVMAFIASFNSLAQKYVNSFNQLNLPIYTGSQLSGSLLDWVANGLYGISRASLPSGTNASIGALNTFALNKIPVNKYIPATIQNYYVTTDDIFKRVITWHFFKGDGKVFNIRWLKRRIVRFLNGSSGTDCDTSNTDNISVTFGVGGQVNIGLVRTTASLGVGAILNSATLNSFAANKSKQSITSTAQNPMAPIFKSAVDAGVLELPFQFNYVVSI